jgi:predicted RNase H-like HicB family nuclease
MKTDISYSLPVTIFREGDAFVAYTPALDLSSAGKTEEDAKRMFTEAVEIFFEELAGTEALEIVLSDLGWTKKNGTLQPPLVVEHALMNITVPVLTE